jgi:hypothetical protein
MAEDTPVTEETSLEGMAPPPLDAPPQPENVHRFVDFHFRMDALKQAQQLLLENARSKPTELRQVTVADIKAVADELVNYVAQG